MLPTGAELGKFVSAKRACDYVEQGMKLGLGTGSTAAWLVKYLAYLKAEQGWQFEACATSSATTELAESLGIPIQGLDEIGALALAIDGADEFDPALNLIKGGGGALLQEKIVETAAEKLVVITDASKEVDALGAFPLPVEVIKFGWQTTQRLMIEALNDLGYQDFQYERRGGGNPFVTDEEHFIIDLHLQKITDALKLSSMLTSIAGVVETGLFLGMTSAIVVGTPEGSVRVRDAGRADWTQQDYDLSQDQPFFDWLEGQNT